MTVQETMTDAEISELEKKLSDDIQDCCGHDQDGLPGERGCGWCSWALKALAAIRQLRDQRDEANDYAADLRRQLDGWLATAVKNEAEIAALRERAENAEAALAHGVSTDGFIATDEGPVHIDDAKSALTELATARRQIDEAGTLCSRYFEESRRVFTHACDAGISALRAGAHMLTASEIFEATFSQKVAELNAVEASIRAVLEGGAE